jgi:hypothetical protein
MDAIGLGGSAVARSRRATLTRLGASSMTIADSIALVFGVALAMSLPWYHLWSQRPQPVMEPRWRITSLFVEEAVGKASLALIPLMLFRHARLGGLCRPGELLLAVCASCALAEQVDRASGLGTTGSVIEAEEFYWSSLNLAGGACVAAIVGLIFFREKLSDGARSSLLVLAVAGLYPWPRELLDSLQFRLVEDFGLQDSLAWDYGLFIGSFALKNLVPAAIGAAALSDAIRGRFRIGAMAGIGLAMASVHLVVSLALYLPGYYTNAFPPWNNHLFYVLIAAPASAGLLGWLLLQAGRPRWRRCHLTQKEPR